VRVRGVDDIGMLLAPSVVHGLASATFVATASAARGPLLGGAAVLAGLAAWTLGEYVVHRFVEHGPLRRGRLDYVDNHARHHASSWEAAHFVYPLRLTLPCLALVLAGAWLVCRALAPALGFAGGISLAYLLNEWVHFAAHRPALVAGRPWLAAIVRGHLRYHEEDPRRHFGFFTSFWDRVFRTN